MKKVTVTYEGFSGIDETFETDLINFMKENGFNRGDSGYFIPGDARDIEFEEK